MHELQNIIQISIEIAGRVTQSDIIGAVFGQTEQVLGDTLDLRKLQKEGKLGRIEVHTEYNDKGTLGTITIPSHMDTTNTVIIAAALETIEKIGPCQAKAKVSKIENIKEIKVKEIIAHAKEVLKKFMSVSIDSQELIDKVNSEMKMSQATEYKGIVCGPNLQYHDELFFVEGIREVQNLLKTGIKNVAAFGDMSNKETLKELAEKYEIIALVDRGKTHLVKQLMEFADIDNFATPDGHGKIHALNSKELHKAIRNYVSTEQLVGQVRKYPTHRPESRAPARPAPPVRQDSRAPPRPDSRSRQGHPRHERPQRVSPIPAHISTLLKDKKKELHKGEAFVLDAHFNVLGKLPVAEVGATLGGLSNVKAVVVSGDIDSDLINSAERNNVEFLAGDACKGTPRRVKVVV
jgi:DNA primase